MRCERCDNCLRPYQVNIFASNDPGWTSRSETICPHCGYTKCRGGDNIFIVHALTPEEEAAYESDNPFERRDEGIADRD